MQLCVRCSSEVRVIVTSLRIRCHLVGDDAWFRQTRGPRKQNVEDFSLPNSAFTSSCQVNKLSNHRSEGCTGRFVDVREWMSRPFIDVGLDLVRYLQFSACTDVEPWSPSPCSSLFVASVSGSTALLLLRHHRCTLASFSCTGTAPFPSFTVEPSLSLCGSAKARFLNKTHPEHLVSEQKSIETCMSSPKKKH